MPHEHCQSLRNDMVRQEAPTRPPRRGKLCSTEVVNASHCSIENLFGRHSYWIYELTLPFRYILIFGILCALSSWLHFC
ncbi:hypothetical protein EG68_06866 [Paragonimus skrjabini miyazakii]|uniref:Uncharacterized protein n=1 Tax=Paragonimus skrjabini miyazakii TaxID=59628 RepID=A0A8S9YVN6_9TREM|nr:hypothetical protein EG68_06866 [Paragonimus skrjabini miyazakii]